MQDDFQQHLAKLKDELLMMASYAETAVSEAVKAVAERDDGAAQSVQNGDIIIDQYEMKLDELAINLLADSVPSRKDLRLITVAMKTSHDLERVGDEATTIARRALELNREPPIKEMDGVRQLATMAIEMLNSSLDALVNGDCVLAHAVIARDHEADVVYHELYRELFELMQTRPGTIERCLHLMVVSKSLERVADHATNIAEEAVYLFEGRDIRHTGKGTRAPAIPNQSTI